ncbi:Macrolide-specific efflux protein macA precursor [Fulvivirga imtechensis AK7]|uniref:Macrolide-specific efflux protein macA n=1 Tax=Fulvivirga imtechensis AK7 TaxID=1237149 RepID=L8JJ37_9BACT|nr:efflux RND transporter periplasmic adaptor subunit [Fulvivirga imtechensis]ELR68911.1 Macrolide-specific efflux protein macA precursor [Fulvivirga imtechensis AK7]
MKKKILIAGGVGICILVIFFLMRDSATGSSTEVFVKAKQGDFKVDITTTGELEAKNSVKIMGPSGLRTAQIWQVKIDHIVDEGTVVKKGDYIARLDKSELMDKIQNANNDLQQSLSKYTQTKLDTALELRKARDELINLNFGVEEKEIILSQSQFEPPASIKQAEINLEKAKRAYEQARENYKLQSRKAVAQMQEAAAKLAEDQGRFDLLNKILADFNIMAPEPGMVIYKRSWNGTKQGIGSTIQPWDPVVATLPDLSSMISKTYVNEVDIRVIKEGQKVNIGLDAFPEKRLTGKVIQVANIGEQKPNSDAKVFQVNILINESDTTLRPAMTTSNNIIAEVIPNVVYVPLECLHNQGDSLTYVIKKAGMGGYKKQQVKIGKTNMNEAVIEMGVAKGEELFLSIPAGLEESEVTLLEGKEGIAAN